MCVVFIQSTQLTCFVCYLKILVWHTQTKKNEPSLNVDKEKYKNTNILSLKDIIVWHTRVVVAAGYPLSTVFFLCTYLRHVVCTRNLFSPWSPILFFVEKNGICSIAVLFNYLPYIVSPDIMISSFLCIFIICARDFCRYISFFQVPTYCL